VDDLRQYLRAAEAMIGGPNKTTLKLKLMPNQLMVILYCMTIFLPIKITWFTLKLLSVLQLINKKVEVSKIVALLYDVCILQKPKPP